MVVGFNHNFQYQGVVYHVQTEDGGLKSPQIVTLLYRGGTILASKKTSYADIAKVDNLDQVVEELMKEQHKEMLRRLKDGEFDHLLGDAAAAGGVANSTVVSSPAPTPPSQPSAKAAPVGSVTPARKDSPTTAAGAVPPDSKEETASELDDIILSYLAGDD